MEEEEEGFCTGRKEKGSERQIRYFGRKSCGLGKQLNARNNCRAGGKREAWRGVFTKRNGNQTESEPRDYERDIKVENEWGDG